MDKNGFRDKCKKKLLRQKNIYIKDQKINKNLTHVLHSLGLRSILFYYPFKFEPDTRKTLKMLVKQRLELFLPLMQDVSFKAVKYRLPLAKNSVGIVEPNDSFFYKNVVDAAVIPVIGVDKNFKRVGFGKGMYDRFFEKYGDKVIKIFVQREVCYTDALLCQDHDIGADFFIDPSRILKIRRDGNGNRVGCYDYSSASFGSYRGLCDKEKTWSRKV